MNSQDKDMLFMRLELEQAQKQLADLKATIRNFTERFDRPEFICPELVYALDPEKFDKIARRKAG